MTFEATRAENARGAGGEERSTVEPKTVGESKITISQQMLPSDANSFGFVHGGTIMKLVDTAAGVVAMRHARRRVATAAIDSMSFLSPVRVGDLVTVRASVNDVGRTSMEVGVRVDVEDLLTGWVTHTSSAYLVMVALDEQGRPAEVPGLIAETEEERRRMAKAKTRRARREWARRHPVAEAEPGEALTPTLSQGERESASPFPRGEGGQGVGSGSLPAPGEGVRSGPTFGIPARIPPGRSARPVVVGHRGAAGHAPENTLAAFERGLALGADVIECDVHLTRDGRLAIIHDHTVDRTTSGAGPVGGYSLAELKALDAGAWRGPEFAGQRVPALEEVLDLARGRARVAIEVKQGPVFYPGLEEALVATLERFGAVGEVLVISFDHRSVRRVRELNPAVAVGVLYSARPVDPAALASAAGAQALLPHWALITREDVEEAHRAGLLVLPWTANEPELIARLLAMGVDGAASDYPDRLRAVADGL